MNIFIFKRNFEQIYPLANWTNWNLKMDGLGSPMFLSPYM